MSPTTSASAIIGASLPDLYPDNGPCGLANDGNNLYVNYWHGAVVNPDTGVIDARTVITASPSTRRPRTSTSTSATRSPSMKRRSNPATLRRWTIGTGGSLVERLWRRRLGLPRHRRLGLRRRRRRQHGQGLRPGGQPNGPGQGHRRRRHPAGGLRLTRRRQPGDQPEQRRTARRRQHPAGLRTPAAVVDEFNAEGLYRGQLEHTIVDGEPTGIAFDESATADQRPGLRDQRQRLEHRDPARIGPARRRTGRALRLRPRRPRPDARSDHLRQRARARSPAPRPGSTARAPAKPN